MKKSLLVILAVILVCNPNYITAQTNVIETDLAKELKEGKKKPTYKFGGVLEGRAMFDTYKSQTSRDGVMYFFPLAPSYDKLGNDINKQGETHFSVFSSKLSFSITGFRVAKADASVYIEGDFMGTEEKYVQMYRMRHAYFKLNWEKSEFLFGQTTHLCFSGLILPDIISFAAGIPFNSLNRGVQARYTRSLSKSITLRVAAEMYGIHNTAGPVGSQNRGMMPDMHLQLQFGNEKDPVFGGITAGTKLVQPRVVTNDDIRTTKKVASADISAFLGVNVQNYKFRLWGIYGGNLSYLNPIGGYGKVLSDPAIGNYNFTNINSTSVWFDMETPSFKNFQFGFFAAYQGVTGSNKPIDLAQNGDGTYKYTYVKNPGLVWYNRISPRMYYRISKQFRVGLEYDYASARWTEEFDKYYKPSKKLPITSNNRIELLAQFVF